MALRCFSGSASGAWARKRVLKAIVFLLFPDAARDPRSPQGEAAAAEFAGSILAAHL
jgi:hypothetical protein